MCGIFGAIGNFDHKIFKEAVRIIEHRGPDDEGIYLKDNVALGHRRLSILDTSDSAHQPMISSDGRFIITYNGEIYNHLELRKGIENKYTFHSTGDTETLLNAYIEYGNEVFSLLNGIFAIAIYDSVQNQITLARDHFGVKPLYYYIDSERFLFGSEIKSINLFPIDRTLNFEAIYDYLRFLYAPFQNTPFKNVRKLEPGNFMTFKTNDFGNYIKNKFYEISYNGDYQINKENIAINEIDQLLSESVSRQMISDVPIGFFLSGGLDSSAVVAMARKNYPGSKMECFSIDTSQYGDYDGFCNDLHYARIVADKFECNLNVIEANSDILKSFKSMVWNLDEPQTDPASFHVKKISINAYEMGIKVLLGGTGGDDVFSGYRRHQALYYERYIKWLPASIKRKLADYGRKVNNNNAFSRRIGKILSNLDLNTSDRLFNYHMWLPEEQVLGLMSDTIKEEIWNYEPRGLFMNMLDNIPDESSWLNKMLYWEQNSYSVDNNLNYMDKSGMAGSIETRVPFLDVELVNFASKLDPDLKLKGMTTKYLLRKMMEQYLPKKIVYRPKTGFGAPVRKWVREDMKEMIGDILSPRSIENRGIFDADAVWRLIDQNNKGKIDAAYTIWSLLAIETWMRLFLDKK